MDPEKIQRAKEKVFSQDRFQQDLPDYTFLEIPFIEISPDNNADPQDFDDSSAPTDSPQPEDSEYLGRHQRGSYTPPSRTESALEEVKEPNRPSAFSNELVAWGGKIAVGLILLLLLFWLARWITGRSRHRITEEMPTHLSLCDLLDPNGGQLGLDPQKLAQDSKFDEAIHVMLLQSLLRIAKLPEHQLSPAWTSWEVLQHLKLPDTARAPLQRLIAAVERCRFAERPADASLYKRCRNDFEQLHSISLHLQERK